MVSPALTSFNTGQVSPLMEGRADFQKYSSSCRKMENVLVTTQGPAVKRPGTRFIAATKANGEVRLIPFEYSTSDTYILETGNGYFRFYRDGGQILDSGSPYEIVSPFGTDDLLNIQFAQTDNMMYMVDGAHHPQKLSRLGHTSWVIEDADFQTGPFLPENLTTTTITPSAKTGSITLAASGNIFQAGHVGSIWQINQKRASSILTAKLSSNKTSLQSVYFQGGFSFITTGTWDATVTLERSTNNGVTWAAALAPLNGANFDNPAETEEDGAIYRVVMSDYVSGTCDFTLTITDQMNKGVVKITAVASAVSATATVLAALSSTTATTQWREGYWSDYRGWPKTVGFHQQRIVFGGSNSFPQTVWFGKADPDDYLNFTEGTLDTAAFTIALPGQNQIQWLLSQDYLFIGTAGSAGKYGEQGKAITPTSPNYTEQVKSGSSNIRAVAAGDSILYVERGGRKVRELAYSLQADKYQAPDLTILAEDITESGIRDIAFQSRPDPMKWCVLNDGTVAVLTYQREQEVIAWTKQILAQGQEAPLGEEYASPVILGRGVFKYIELSIAAAAAKITVSHTKAVAAALTTEMSEEPDEASEREEIAVSSELAVEEPDYSLALDAGVVEVEIVTSVA